ncbi:P-loop ATPase, Sll1717 family [Dyadobacter sp. OTU695]|uniref:P-loop ATPase, Sll1717 family n=1 Tax=Dyadobacter sp. OTU695 TaxID=3043860 RepID=UPI00313CB732
MEQGFFAYSSQPSSSGEAIEEAVREINKGNLATITTWRGLRISGRIIIKEILDQIDKSDFFCADLTGMNDNVLFEIGYAIGRAKPIWLVFDTSYAYSQHRFKEFQLLSTVGYSKYTNTQNLVQSFYQQEIGAQGQSIISQTLSQLEGQIVSKPFLYLKSQVATNYSQEIINQADFNNLKPIIDDAGENKIESLEWYIENILKAPALLAEFSTLARVGFELQNSKCAFLSGLAIGLDKKVLMVAERPYEEAPIDYRDLLKKYSTREQCAQIIKPFFEDLKKIISELFSNRRELIHGRKLQSNLQKINFGEFTAEHESDKIYEYYVETSHIETLVRNEYSIIVGRKGSGKTAALYYLDQLLSNDKRNFVCVIKPVNFEVEGVIRLLEMLSEDFEQGFVIEAVWKFLIYTEVAKTIYDKLKNKPLYSLTEQEIAFNSYIKLHENIFATDFSTRLEEQIEEILRNRVSIGPKQSEFRIRISEYLHNNIILQIREHLANIIGKNEKIIVLIDNLDKSWKKSGDLKVISKYILGLLGATGRIAKDLAVIKSKQRNLTFNLILFLRSDIFKYIMAESREPDKIEFSKIKWEDPELFFRIIEERFVQLSTTSVQYDDLWNNYVAQDVDQMPTRDYIIERVFPRPRDIIYFFRRAKEVAVSRGHAIIKAEDIRQAYSDYSSWVFQSIIVENGVTVHQMSDFMYHLAGGNNIISKQEIGLIMDAVSINRESDLLENFIDHLVSLSILGRETRENIFRFEYDMDNSEKVKILANKLGSNRLMIHRALYPHLEIEES